MSRLKESSDSSSTAAVADMPEEKDVYIPKSKRQLWLEKLQPFIDEETKMVKGRFRNYESPGQSHPVQILKYPGVPEFSKIMMDNEVYTIPLYVARFINGIDITATHLNCKIYTCSSPIHSFLCTNQDTPTQGVDNGGTILPLLTGITKRNKRIGFDSMEFDLD
jgi:hypothetical protein